jgi:hypothetical protein
MFYDLPDISKKWKFYRQGWVYKDKMCIKKDTYTFNINMLKTNSKIIYIPFVIKSIDVEFNKCMNIKIYKKYYIDINNISNI